jgi:hypothetical protein
MLQVGDKVILTNGYGVIIGGIKTVTEEDTGRWTKKVKRYFISPIGTPWYSFPENRLEKVKEE